MRKVLLALGILALICTPAMAGRNANGALIVHTNDSYNYSSQTVCTTASGNPGTCEAANTQSDRYAGAVVWLLAAFDPLSSPGVTVIYFGINYDDANLDPGGALRFCGPAGTLEVADPDWPYTGRGNSVAFGSPVYSTLFVFYAFQIQNFGAGGEFFCTAINPTGGYAAFVDDGNPPGLDQVYNFGCVVWGAPGHNDCPRPPVNGACCFDDGSCQVVDGAQTCAALGGRYQGDNSLCDPNPCEQPAACCFEDGHCEMLLRAACDAAGGAYMGGTCEPQNPCPQPLGACCFEDGSCSMLTQQACVDAGGNFLGGNCEPTNPCPPPPPTGACCTDGVCTETTEANCGGVWNGNAHCDDPGFQCPPVATKNATWGQIKANYR